jgi:anti-anti-sigma factor
MKLNDEERLGVLVVHVVMPRIDALCASAFKEEIAARIEKGHHRLVLDLSDVDFVDSSGLGALVACLKRIGPLGTIAIVGTKGVVSKLFTLTKMDRVFPLYDTVDAAIEHMPA